MKLEKNNTYGIIGTIVVHGIVLLILLLFGFAPPKVEFPEPDGILVDFGDLVIGDNTGAESPSSVTEPVTAQPEVNDAPTVTQTEVPSIPVKTNKNKVEETKTPELSPEEQERIRQEAEFKAKMDALTGKLGGGGSTGEGTAGNSNEGKTNGNAGRPNGGKSPNKKGTYGSPYGNGDAVQLVKPSNTTNCNNPIVLNVKVDANGNVIEIQSTETALSEQSCIDAAKAAARKTKFPPQAEGSGIRYAKITYEYTVSHK